jgi:hypothetical protein
MMGAPSMTARERRHRALCAFIACLQVLACTGGQTGSEGAQDRPPGRTEPPGDVPGMGPGGCASDRECSEQLAAYVAELQQPREQTARTLVDAECVAEVDTGECPRSRSCKCVYTTADRNGEYGAEAFALGLDFGGCDHVGRSGECLIASSDFAGCEPGDRCSCAPACEDAIARIAADERRAFDAEARHAECVASGCRSVLRVEDGCFALGAQESGPYDCALGDAEILERAFPTAPGSRTSGEDVVFDAGRPVASCGWGVGACANCYQDAGPLECDEPDGG